MDEFWKDIPDHDDYEASLDGDIRRKLTGRIFQVESKKHRYRMTNICGKTVAVHRLIALTFCPNPDNLPQVNHKDGNRRNNKADNLEWISASNNVKHAILLGRNDGKSAKSSVIITFKDSSTNKFNTIKEASKFLNVPAYSITYVLKRNNGYYYGPTSGLKHTVDNWLWKVDRDITISQNDIEERPITISGFTHLIACSNGIILNAQKRKPVGTSDGRYLRIKPSTKGEKIGSKSAHQLIALMFIPNPDNKPYVNHIDGLTINNAVSNLEWVSQAENMQHARRTGLISQDTQKTASDKLKVRVYQLELDGSIIKTFDSVTDADKVCSNASTICSSFLKNTKDANRHHSGGYGWCFEKDYIKKPNKRFADVFPELIGRTDIQYDKLRINVINGSRPLWQIELDGTRIKLWNTRNEVIENIPNTSASNLWSSLKLYGNHLAGGWAWKDSTYEEIINPALEYVKEVPVVIRNALKMHSNQKIKPEIVGLLRENISTDGSIRFRTKPIVQLNLDNSFVKYWSGPYKAMHELGYGRNQIEHVLYGGGKSAKGYKWRWMTDDELFMQE